MPGRGPSAERGCRVARHPAVTRLDQLQPEVLPQPSQMWQEPAGRILIPQVMHSGASAALPNFASISSAEECTSELTDFAGGTAHDALDADEFDHSESPHHASARGADGKQVRL